MTEQSRLQLIKQILATACKLPTEERAAYLDVACGEDRALRAELDALIAKQDMTTADMDHVVEIEVRAPEHP